MRAEQQDRAGSRLTWLAVPVLCCVGHPVLLALCVGSLAAVVGGSTGRTLLAATGPDARAVYGALLPAFAAFGLPPGPDTLAASTGLPSDTVLAALRELAAADLVALGPDGHVVGAFPLSAVPTRCHVHVGGRRVLHVMCAVDALGIPAMLGAAGTVTSADPAQAGASRCGSPADGALNVSPPEVRRSCCSPTRATDHWRRRAARSSTFTPTEQLRKTYCASQGRAAVC